VTGDVLAAGGSITIGGTVDGDARLAGGTISVGGTVTVDPSAGTAVSSSAWPRTAAEPSATSTSARGSAATPG
jgi:hypothetical protein